MHKAPAVSCLLEPSGFQPMLMMGAWMFTALVGVGLYFETRSITAIGCLIATGMLVGIGSRLCFARQAKQNGRLSWDGATWAWTGFDLPSPCRLVVHLDLQSFMLIRVHGDGGSNVWLWLERRVIVSHWVALRRALYAGGRAGQNSTPSTRLPEALF